MDELNQVDWSKKIIGLLERSGRRMLSRRSIAEDLQLRGGERKRLSHVLQQLVKQGVLDERKGQYRLAEQGKELVGRFSATEHGYGFVRSEKEQFEDLFVSASSVSGAMDGDLVKVRLAGRDRNGRSFGRVVKVLERAHKSVLGVYHCRHGKAWVEPLNHLLGRTVYVQDRENMSVAQGDVVSLEFTRYPSSAVAGSGRVVEVIGAQDDPLVDIAAVIRAHALPKDFSAEALAEAKQVASKKVSEQLAGRKDLRHLPLVTVDGETAKDFDDAIAVRKEADGRFRLWVCIADVAHYVTEKGSLDAVAQERGTSVYFPGYCLPMLPELLSNGVCSLRPDEDRLVMTAELTFAADGNRTADFYPAIMRSRARLTYSQVSDFFSTGELSGSLKDLREQLLDMRNLAKLLGERCRERGRLNLEIPEVEIRVDDEGKPVAAVRQERTEAHQLVEEFMLAANEAVAAYLEENGCAFLYRVHEEPNLDKLYDFQQLTAESGYGFSLRTDLQKEIQRLLGEVAGSPEAGLINQQLLRCLQQARYSPVNKGHFGLSASSYCHFTSPIRRYPDLLVHRTLKKVLAGHKVKAEPEATLLQMGELCSDTERRAMAAERELIELRRCQLMKNRLGEEFTGTIVSVTEFGFFVELDQLCVEGLVHIRTLGDDYYLFDPGRMVLQGERRRRLFKIGLPVVVRLERVELGRKRIDFALVEVR